uniref:J domain-containing protein n=1 Tax=Syphacia muris TaxID=451379 RepID=A0A0N5AS58_9BILA
MDNFNLFKFITIIVFARECATIGLAPGIYCGEESCYDDCCLKLIYGQFLFFGHSIRKVFSAFQNDLSKIYRRLARKYHPDKVKEPELKAEAVEKFRKIATAYETLKDDGTREDYDYYLDHPEHRAYNYYQYYRRRVAPKVDVRIVIIVTVVLISVFQYLSAKHKYGEALSYVIRQPKYQNGAREIARKRGLLPSDDGRNGKRVGKRLAREEIDAIIRGIIEENMDIRWIQEALGAVKTSKSFILMGILQRRLIFMSQIFRYCVWKIKWIINYWIKKLDYDEESKLYLIRKNMGLSESQFACLIDEYDEFLAEELWKKDIYNEWKKNRDAEEKEKLANSGRYKRYRRYMKNQAGSRVTFMED